MKKKSRNKTINRNLKRKKSRMNTRRRNIKKSRKNTSRRKKIMKKKKIYKQLGGMDSSVEVEPSPQDLRKRKIADMVNTIVTNYENRADTYVNLLSLIETSTAHGGAPASLDDRDSIVKEVVEMFIAREGANYAFIKELERNTLEIDRIRDNELTLYDYGSRPSLTDWGGFTPAHDDATVDIRPLPPNIKLKVSGGQEASFRYPGKYIYVILFDEPNTLYYCYDLLLYNYTRLIGEHQSCISGGDEVEELVEGYPHSVKFIPRVIHSHLADNKNVILAGEITADGEGNVVSFNINSGHYKPLLEYFDIETTTVQGQIIQNSPEDLLKYDVLKGLCKYYLNTILSNDIGDIHLDFIEGERDPFKGNDGLLYLVTLTESPKVEHTSCDCKSIIPFPRGWIKKMNEDDGSIYFENYEMDQELTGDQFYTHVQQLEQHAGCCIDRETYRTSTFGYVNNKRHHCRYCGLSFCTNCLKNDEKIGYFRCDTNIFKQIGTWLFHNREMGGHSNVLMEEAFDTCKAYGYVEGDEEYSSYAKDTLPHYGLVCINCANFHDGSRLPRKKGITNRHNPY
jgi:hypothetical protein